MRTIKSRLQFCATNFSKNSRESSFHFFKGGWIYSYKGSKGSKTHVTMQDDIGLYTRLSQPIRSLIQYMVATCLCTVAWRKIVKKM